jgi:hypothetical protein
VKALFVSIVAALALAGAATAAQQSTSPPTTPKATSLTLDSFTLSPDVKYLTNNFWCEYNNYGLYFSNYDGRCPYQDYVASLHWKKVRNITEYDICLKPVFRDYSPGFACSIMQPPKAGNPASLSMTFDSDVMFLNSVQGTTQVWMVKACNYVMPGVGSCSESNTVSADIPWTG